MIWPSVIAGVSGIIAAAVGLIIRNQLAVIHVLVNKRLDDALKEIAELKASVKFEKTQLPEDKS